jgi:Protein of unknown function (DUF1326)
MFTSKALIVLLTSTFLIGLCNTLATADEPKQEPAKKTHWKISGELEEACSCHAACPCWFGSLPSMANCSGSQVLFITKGHYGDVKLDGLAIGNMAQSPDNQTMMDSFGKWNFSYLYVDEKANPDQRKALEEIGKTVLPFAASHKTEIRYVPISRIIQGKEHMVSLGQSGSYGSVSGHLLDGGLPGTPKIVNPPGADPIHHEYLQGRTTKLLYTDEGQNWNFKDSNYMQGTFTVTSEQYEKYAAGLAQKMAGMKKAAPEQK